MTTADRVKEQSTSTSTSNIVLGGTTPGFRAVASAFSVGDTGVEFLIGPDSAGAWLLGEYTIGSGTLTRTAVVSSSAGVGVDVPTLAAGTKDVVCTVSSAMLDRMQLTRDVPFNSAVPLDRPGSLFMSQHNVAGALSISIAGTPKRGAFAYLRLVADGVNQPIFPGLEHGGSSGYDNRNGIVNIVEIFNDGYTTWHSISQAVGAAPVDATAPTHVNAIVENATPTLIVITMSEALDATANPATSLFAIAGRTVSTATITGATIRIVVSVALVGGQSYSVVYTPSGGTAVKDPSGNQAAGFTVGVTNNITVPDTTAPTLTALTASAAGPTTAAGSVTTTGDANGTLFWLYSTASTATVPALEASATSQAITSTGSKSLPGAGLTASTQYYLHALHRDAAGNKATNVSTFGPFTTGATASAPAAPTIGTAVGGAGYVDVVFTPGADNGAAIIDHTALLSTGESATGASSPVRVTVANTTERSATVTSRNSVGSSPASAASNSVAPTAAPDYPRFVSKDANLAETGSGPWTYTGINAGTYVDQRACLNRMFGAAGVDGGIKIRYEQIAGNGFTFGLSSSPTAVSFAAMAGVNLIVTGGYYAPGGSSGVNHGANMAPAEGDIWYFRRSGTAIIIEIARAATPTNFVPIGTWATGINSTINKYFNLVVASDAKFTLLEAPGLVASA